MKKWLLAAVFGLFTVQAMAADPVKERQDVFKDYKKVMGEMGKIMKASNNEKDFPKPKFAQLANELNTLAQKPWKFFPAGSHVGKSHAKPEIWSQPKKWQEEIDRHKTATAKLKDVATTGNLGEIKKQFGAVGQTCKSCHDSFREKQS